MADQRVITPVVLTDPSTGTQQVGVDASGNLQVILASNTGVDIGDVDVTSIIPGTGATNLGKAVDDVAGATDTGIGILAVRDDALGGVTPVEGDYVNLFVDANGAVWVRDVGIDAALAGTELQVDVVASLPAGDNNIGNVDIVTGPTGASALEVQGTAADGAAATGNPVLVAGVDGSANAQTVSVGTNGRLQVDVITGGGVDSPTNPTFDLASSTNTAAGGSADLDSAEIVEAEKLWMVQVSASVPFKVQIIAVENSVPRNLSNLLFGRAGETVVWEPPHRDFAAHAGASGGTDVFRATVTNMDPADAADLHAGFYYST